MHQVETKTILNDAIEFLDAHTGPIATKSQLTQNILNSIQAGRRNFKPYIPKKICQYPNPPKIDDFNTGEGLGVMSLQPIVDGLNNFKNAAIADIKSKFQAMGPENAKDSKLAIGAVEVIKQVYDAAKCYTQIVTNVNNLVSTYISVIDFIIVDVISKINELETQVNQLKAMFFGDQTVTYLINLGSKELLDALQRATSIFDILGAVVELQNALGEAELATKTLKDTDKRIRKHLMIGLTLLQNRINSFLYYQSLKNSLDTSSASAQASKMTDDFLDNFNFTEVQESSFNWSLTNSGAIYDCNSNDEITLIPRLNKMMQEYKSGITAPVIIASRNEEGNIIVSENVDGLISAGLDPRAGYDVGLIFELSINNGETIIRCDVRGEQLGPNDSIFKRFVGKYYNYGKETFEYNKIINNGDGTYTVYLFDVSKTSDIVIGSNYYFVNPSTNTPWTFSWHNTVTGENKSFPLLFKVIDTTKNTVTLKILGSSDLIVTDFLTGVNPAQWTFVNSIHTAPPGDINGNLRTYIQSNGHYLVVDQFGNQKYHTDGITPIIDTDIGFIGTPDLWNVNVTRLIDHNYIMYVDFSTITLNKYTPISMVHSIPHTGEKIHCKNWALSVYPVGDYRVINKIRFSSNYPGEDVYLFFLKAKWGFIPIQS